MCRCLQSDFNEDSAGDNGDGDNDNNNREVRYWLKACARDVPKRDESLQPSRFPRWAVPGLPRVGDLRAATQPGEVAPGFRHRPTPEHRPWVSEGPGLSRHSCPLGCSFEACESDKGPG